MICRSVKLGLLLKDGLICPMMLFVVPLICEPLTWQPLSFRQDNFECLQDLALANPSDFSSRLDVHILIGSDMYWQLVTGETRCKNPGPVAVNTVLGLVLSGPVSSTTPDVLSICLFTHTLRVDGSPQEVQDLDNQLKSFWELESFGVSH